MAGQRKAPARKLPKPRARAQTRTSKAAQDRVPVQTGASALVAQLEALGVDVVFGIPGVHNLAIFEALDRSPIRTVLVRHEQTAVYAADGYARATGRLGVAVTTTGPGAANTAAAMGEAWSSRSPLLHISTQLESRLLEGKGGRWSLHESPHQRELMDAVARWSGTVAAAEAIPTMVARAAREAFAGRRGPVFLEIPHDYLSAPVAWRAQPPPKQRPFAPEPQALARALTVLKKARRPVIWAGGGAVAAGAAQVLAKVAEALDAPVVTTFAGKGLLPPDHPLAVAAPPHEPAVTKLLAGSDATFIIGSDLDGMDTQGWRIPLPRPRVSINTVAEDARRNYASDVVVEADALLTLEAMLPELPVNKAQGARRVAEVHKAVDASLRAHKDFAAPYRFVREIATSFPEGAFLVADMAVAGYWLAGYFAAPSPRCFAFPLGWGSLGYALPAGVGAAASGRRTIVVTGDAGLLYAPGELATAVQENLPLTIVVVNDEGYGMLRFDEGERFGRTFAADLSTPDFTRLADSFGMKARACKPKDFHEALAWALKHKGPALVELRARFAPPITTSPRWPLKGKKEARP
ncbi:MAG: thiamine pyrophosphate-binding protein [Actinomycetota bacterium]